MVLGSKGMSETTNEMLHLSRDMNASTSLTMGRLFGLVDGINPEDVNAVVKNAVQISHDVRLITGAAAKSGNITALISGVYEVIEAIDPDTVTSALTKGATVIHSINEGVNTLNVTRVVSIFKQIIAILNPAAIDTIFCDVRNITSGTRQLVDRVTSQHSIQLDF